VACHDALDARELRQRPVARPIEHPAQRLLHQRLQPLKRKRKRQRDRQPHHGELALRKLPRDEKRDQPQHRYECQGQHAVHDRAARDEAHVEHAMMQHRIERRRGNEHVNVRAPKLDLVEQRQRIVVRREVIHHRLDDRYPAIERDAREHRPYFEPIRRIERAIAQPRRHECERGERNPTARPQREKRRALRIR
jgi:hypothetical protein